MTMKCAIALCVEFAKKKRKKNRVAMEMQWNKRWNKRLSIVKMLLTTGSLAVASYEFKKLSTRRTWADMEDMTNNDEFYEIYRMNRQSFFSLLQKVRLVPDFEAYGAEMCLRQDLRPVEDEIKLAIALRVLAGSTRRIDVAQIYGLSKSCISKWFFAMLPIIIAALPLSINLEDIEANDPKLKSVAQGFKNKSTCGIDKCIGAIDGCAVRIRQPSQDDVQNASNYYNRKGFHALNMQAICDASRRFIWYCCKSAGSTHDSTAFVSTVLYDRLKTGLLNLAATGYFLIGDEAYALDDFIMVPFSGTDLEEFKDSFNYYASQLRINIECAFGMLVNKWRILTAALPYKMFNNIMVIRTCLHLHNYCIDESIRQGRYDDSAKVEGNNKLHEQHECAIGEAPNEIATATTTALVKRGDMALDINARGYRRPRPETRTPDQQT